MKLELIKNLIKEKGGTFIEEKTIKSRKYIKIICNNGHESTKRDDSFPKTWCKFCQNLSIKDVHNLAKKRNFQFLSETYINANTKYTWKCEKGHIWEAKYNNIHSGKGCPICLTIPYTDCVKSAKENGGLCLTSEEEFKGIKTRMNWKCKNNHIWETTYQTIRQGSWCPECNVNLCERTCKKILEYIFKKDFSKIRPSWLDNLELDGYNEELKLAFEYNGAQHYRFIKYWHKTLDYFELKKEHDKKKIELCEKKGINLIVIPYTVNYKDLYSFILQECKQYDELKETPKFINYDVLNLKSLNIEKLESLNKYVKEKFKGKLISNIYHRNDKPLNFICKNNHEFKQTWNNIRQYNSFCKICTYDKIREETEIIVLSFCGHHNLELLENYKKAKQNLKIKCLDCENIQFTTWDSIRLKKVPCC
jgi:hypothetical protein